MDYDKNERISRLVDDWIKKLYTLDNTPIQVTDNQPLERGKVHGHT